MLPMLLFVAARAYLQALKTTRAMVIATIVGNVLNLGLDVLFVFTFGMGVAGAAIATVICAILQTWILAYYVGRIPVEGTVDRSFSSPDVQRAFRIGLPVGLHMGAEVGVFALVALLAGRMGTVPMAAHQVVISIASLTFTVAVGVATAGSVRVGYGVGAGDKEATRLAGHVTFATAALVMGTSAICFATFPAQIARLVTDQRDIVAGSVPLMIVAAFFQLSDGIQAAGAGVLRGAADTHFVFWANLFGHWIIGLPIALLLGFTMKMGIVGLWWGLSAGLTVVAVLLFVRFERLSKKGVRALVC
jgi:MATE family multidrug resistance protein